MSVNELNPKIRCVIYRTTSIGDVILATSVLDVLQKLEIAHEVHWIGRQPAMNLISTSFPDYHFYEITDDDGSRKVYEELCKVENLHFIIDLQKSLRSKRFCGRLSSYHNAPIYTWDKHSLFRAKLIINAKLRGRSKPAPEEVYLPSFYQCQQMAEPMVAALRDILPELNYDPVRHGQARPTLNLSHEAEVCDKTWAKELKLGRWLAIAPGASYAAKKAPSDFYISVLAQLNKQVKKANMELGLVFLGSQEDRVDALAIADAVNWPFPILNLCGKLTLLESAIALSYTKGILSNDSSLGHISEALGRPSSVVYGPTAEGFGFPPWRQDSAAHSAMLGCRPCSKHGQKTCRYGDLKCYSDIDRAVVSKHVFQIVSA